MSDKRPHLSHTQIDMYLRCPEQYRRRYIEGEKLLPGIALMEGSAVHIGAETNFKQKIESHQDMPIKDVVEAAVAGWEAKLAEGYELAADEVARGAGIVLGEAKDGVVGLATLHGKEQAPDYQPVGVEVSTLIELPDATHDLLTVTDLVDDLARVTDLKTAKRSKPASEVETSTQLTIYAAAFATHNNGALPIEVRLDVLVKTKVPKRQVLKSTRTMRDIEVLSNRINVVLAAIQTGSFPPCVPGSWNCSAKWCGYWPTCRYVNSERQAAAETE